MEKSAPLTVSWFGHSLFLFEYSGLSIATDPYDPPTGYRRHQINAEAVTVSHDHHDHNDISMITGMPIVVRSAGSHNIDGVTITGIPSYHDEARGAKRGSNLIFIFEFGELTLAHMGDFGQDLTREQLDALLNIDVLLLPVGGTYTIDALQAAGVVKAIMPKIAIPMHYKTDDSAISIAPVQPFLEQMPVVKQLRQSTVTIQRSTLPEPTEVWVMDYS